METCIYCVYNIIYGTFMNLLIILTLKNQIKKERKKVRINILYQFIRMEKLKLKSIKRGLIN